MLFRSQVIHAHNFSKASSKAVDIVVDLLGHYLELLTATCASFAQHAGRDAANVHDAVVALGELGIDIQDIMEWCERDGVELSKFGTGSLREHLEQFSGGQILSDINHILYSELRCCSDPF